MTVSSESETRKRWIDDQLRTACWVLGDPTSVVEEYAINETEEDAAATAVQMGKARVLYADYALIVRGRVVAVVEAKQASVDSRLGQEQVLQYARHIQRHQGGRLPFLLCANGHETWLWDAEERPPEMVRGFPTPQDIEWWDFRREHRRPLSEELIDTGIAGRDYQIAAIRAVLEGMERKRRRFLLVMATGTGKTRTATALIDVLLRGHWAKRVLFLVDRVALRDQAVEAFREHLPDTPYWPRAEGGGAESTWDPNRRIYCTTYQTMLNLIQRGSADDWISPHFFDLVIADESHRSIYNIYRDVLDWFSGIQLGLTATPRDHVDHDTFTMFECDAGEPTFAFTYEEAIRHDPPYLCDFEVLKVRSKFQLEGIQGGRLSAAEQRQIVADGKDPDDLDFVGSDLERKVTNSGTNAVVVREFMQACVKDPTGTLPGKTIFFAISTGHARRLAEMFDQLYPEHAGRLARVLVAADPRVHGKGGLLDQFKNQDMPRIAISVDMLDTGVDVPEVVNLVFAKPVYSYTKFWQMIGRGTRLLPARRKAWCQEKAGFLVIDCWGNFDFFKMHPKGYESKEQVALPVLLFRARLDLLEAVLTDGDDAQRNAVIEDLRSDLATLPQQNATVVAHRQDLAPLAEEQFWRDLTVARLGHLRVRVAPLLRARTGIDDKAIRFEREIVELYLARMIGDAEQGLALRSSLVQQIAELPLSVNRVAAESDRVRQAQQIPFWTDPSLVDLRELARRLAPLMRFRQVARPGMEHLELVDHIVIKERIEFGPEHEGLSSAAYRAKVEAHVRQLVQRNPVMAHIAVGGTPSESDMHQLTELLRLGEPGITCERLQATYDVRAASLVPLLRHVLGLERLPDWGAMVTRAFDEYLLLHNTFSSAQVRFLQTLRDLLLQKRRLLREDLVGPPFTQFHPDGIRGLFRDPYLGEVLQLVEGLVA